MSQWLRVSHAMHFTSFMRYWDNCADAVRKCGSIFEEKDNKQSVRQVPPEGWYFFICPGTRVLSKCFLTK